MRIISHDKIKMITYASYRKAKSKILDNDRALFTRTNMTLESTLVYAYRKAKESIRHIIGVHAYVQGMNVFTSSSSSSASTSVFLIVKCKTQLNS